MNALKIGIFIGCKYEDRSSVSVARETISCYERTAFYIFLNNNKRARAYVRRMRASTLTYSNYAYTSNQYSKLRLYASKLLALS